MKTRIAILACLFPFLYAPAQTRVITERPNPYLEILSKDAKIQEYTVSPTPEVDDEAIFEAIAAKYKGHVVLIDIWSTGCGPCIQNMVAIRPFEALTKEKEVVKVYVTVDNYSPKEKLDKMIPLIGGIHYIITEQQIKTLMTKHGFDGFPTYFIYDKQGHKTWQASGSKAASVDNIMGQLEKVW